VKWAGRVFFVVISLAFVLSLLPTFGVVDAKSCTWEQDGKAMRIDQVNAAALKGLALAVRSNDVEVGKGLRTRIEQGLTSRGVSGAGTVDNPVTYPRLTVTLEALDAGWTPFHSRAAMKVRAQVDLTRAQIKGLPYEADVGVSLTGTCNGLVKKDGWLDEPLDKVSSHIVDKLLP
jgi:hypothetical protein